MNIKYTKNRDSATDLEIKDGICVVRSPMNINWNVDKMCTCSTGLIITPPDGYCLKVVQLSSFFNRGFSIINNGIIIKPDNKDELILFVQNNTETTIALHGGIDMVELVIEEYKKPLTVEKS